LRGDVNSIPTKSGEFDLICQSGQSIDAKNPPNAGKKSIYEIHYEAMILQIGSLPCCFFMIPKKNEKKSKRVLTKAKGIEIRISVESTQNRP